MNPESVVPNQSPRENPGNVRLAVVGEAPAVEEVSWRICSQGHGYAGEHWQNRQLVTRDRCPMCGSTKWTERPTPFVGESGRLLDDLLKSAGLPRERCWVGNVSRRPLAEGDKTLENCRGGLARLALDLEAFKPNAVLVLGNLALTAFLGEDKSVTAWRGSITEGTLEGVSYKIVIGCHPAAILREPSQLVLLRHDVSRAVAEAASSALDLPRRVLDAPKHAYEVRDKLWAMREARQPIGHDIEGGCDVGVTVCSFASSPTHALCIPFRRMDWSQVWSDEDERFIRDSIRILLEDERVPKVAHNAAFECFAWRWLHGIQIQNVHDSMIAFHTLWPELDKGLEVVASILTRGCYWGTPKDWVTDADRDSYNVIDSCVCLECWQALQREMTPAQRGYYEHSRALLEPCGEMSFVGLNYEAELRDDMVARITREIFEAQGKLDTLAGIAPPTFREVVEAVAFKKAWDKCADWPDVLAHAKPSYR